MRNTPRVRRELLWGLILVLLAAFVFHADFLGHVAYAFERGRIQADLDHLATGEAGGLAELDRLSHAFSVVVTATKPSVVHIRALTANENLERLFEQHHLQAPPMTGTGSGVILDEKGYIVTNNHVVDGADVVRVTLSDGRKYRAEIVGTDELTDLAVIKINADRLHPARLGDSDQMKIGYLVLAIGSPFRLDHSVSHGIVSAIGRSEVNVAIGYQDFIQTDAPINPGNSGGPLINTRGEVIGINTAIATESGGHQGVGFAIPSNRVARIAEQLKRNRKVVRGYLGVGIKQVDHKMAAAYGLPRAYGVFVDNPFPDTPAAKSGLKAEDIILTFDHKDVKTVEQLQSLVAATKPDTLVDVMVWRKGSEHHLTIEIGAQPEGFRPKASLRALRPFRSGPGEDGGGEAEELPKKPEESDATPFEKLGFEAATVSPRLAKRFKLAPDVLTGALITHVDSTGEAYAAELRPGQVIVRANGTRVNNVAELEQLLSDEALSRGVPIKIKIGGEDFYTVLQVR